MIWFWSNFNHTANIPWHYIKIRSLGFVILDLFPIIEKIGAITYKILFPPSAKVHPVFRVVNLKACKEYHSTPCMTLPLLTLEIGPVLVPDSVLDSQIIIINGKDVQHLLVKWLHLPAVDATWKNYKDLQLSFANFNLEYKVLFNDGIML